MSSAQDNMVQHNNTKQSIAALLDRGPDFTNDTPIDTFFSKLENNLIDKLRKFDDEGESPQLFEYLGFGSQKLFVAYLIEQLQEIHNILQSNSKHIDVQKDVIPISLNDMKYLDDLINLLIVHGIDAYLPSDCRIPLNEKLASKFSQNQIEKKFTISGVESIDDDELSVIVNRVLEIMLKKYSIDGQKNYISIVLLNGVMYSNIFLAATYLIDMKNYTLECTVEDIENLQETYSLFELYNNYSQTIANHKLKSIFLVRLSTLTYRRENNGLITLVDFILGVREQEQIDIEKFSRLNQILLTRPKTIRNIDYLKNLFNQIYDCMSFINRPLLVSGINGVITEFYFKNKRIVQDFLFQRVYNIFFNDSATEYTYKELNDCINVILSLSKNTSKELLMDFASRNTISSEKTDISFFQYLWVYAVFLKSKGASTDIRIEESGKNEQLDIQEYCNVILSLMKTFLLVFDSETTILNQICQNILNYEHEKWRFSIDIKSGLPLIEVKRNDLDKDLAYATSNDYKTEELTTLFKDMDKVCDLFIELLRIIDDPKQTRSVFLHVFKKWIEDTAVKSQKSQQLSFLSETVNDATTSNLLALVNLKLSQHIIKEFRSEIISSVADILIVVAELFDILDDGDKVTKIEGVISSVRDSDDEDSDDEEQPNGDQQHEKPDNIENELTNFSDNAIDIVIALLESVIGDCSVETLYQFRPTIERLLNKLEAAFPNDYEDIKKQLREVLMYKGSNGAAQNSNKENDEERLTKAIASLADPLVPIRAHGLAELRNLVLEHTKVITIEKVVNIHLEFLSNEDPFLYLNVIKGLTYLIEVDSSGKTLEQLFDKYQSRRTKLDLCLRLGEVFINYVQVRNELVTEPQMSRLVDLCLEKIRVNSSTARAVDDRLRMSALSILGICIKSNVDAITDSRMRDIFDCVFGVLQLETSEPKSILRRAAIHLVHDYLISKLGDSDQEMHVTLPEPYTVEKLTATLDYLKLHDNDYLVHQQCSTIVEELSALTQL